MYRVTGKLPITERGSRPPSRGSRSGMVVFVVMVVIVMVSLAGLSFVLTMSTENKAVHLHGDELQLEQVVASGAELLKAICEMSPAERGRVGGLLDNPDRFRGALVVDHDTDEHRARFSLVAPRIEDGQITGMRFGAENESARLNLAVLPEWEKRHEGAAPQALMSLPGMTESIADAIVDWIDDDASPRPSGAEADYYSSRRVPYGPRNTTPTSLDELLLIRDVSREMLFGADADFNYRVEEEELRSTFEGPGIGMSGRGLPWASLLTVYSAERNTTFEGNPRINLNEKDLTKLHGQLSKAFDSKWAKFIIAYRQFGPYKENEQGNQPKQAARQAKQAAGPVAAQSEASSTEIDLSLPAKFRIDSVLDLIGVKVQLPGKETRSGQQQPGPILESPLADDRVAMRDDLPELLDLTTVTTDKVLRGRINVNLAPREVLLAVPGMDASVAGQIIASRSVRFGDDDPERRHPAWLLTEGIVDLEQMKTLMPYLTTGGDVFRAQVVAFFDDSDLSARAEIVVDATVAPPRQVYWKDVRLLGRGYPREALGAEIPADAAPASRPDDLLESSQFD